MDMGGGGGGGGVIYNSSYAVTANTPITVTVGNGGVGAPAAGTNGQPTSHQYTIPATSGQNSVFGTLTAICGGFGGSSYRGYTPGISGGNGGSGGGSGGYNDNAGTFYGGMGTAGQGYRGGNSTAAYYSGGGGGAGGEGVDSTNRANGGIGYYSCILCPCYYWGGGGGGAGYSIGGGDGGAGGGGGGAVGMTIGGSGLNNGTPGTNGCTVCWANVPGGNGGANTGGGGGGGSHYNGNNKGGNGGSGIVIVRLSSLTKDATTKVEGSASMKLTIGAPQVDANTVALWHLDETSPAVANPVSTYSYTGAAQTFTAPSTATYKIEVWGAQGGGSETSRGAGGLGGYAYGEIALNANDVLNVYVGGSPGSINSWNAGWNGGATGCGPYGTYNGGAAGGGASDIRQGGTALTNRIIVAGGGGGGGVSSSAGGAGGGLTG